MQRPFNKNVYNEYIENLEKYIDHLESKRIPSEELKLEILTIIRNKIGNESFESIADKLLELLQPKGIEFPDNDERLKACREIFKPAISVGKSTALKEEYPFLTGAEWMANQIKKLNNIS